MSLLFICRHRRVLGDETEGGRRGANTDLMTCVFFGMANGRKGGAVLLPLIGALQCALLQDYYINWSDLITLGMREKRMEYVISLQIHTS